MKKVVMVLAVLFLVIFSTGCESYTYVDPSKDEFGNTVYTTSTEHTVYLSSLPYTIPYGRTIFIVVLLFTLGRATQVLTLLMHTSWKGCKSLAKYAIQTKPM